MELDEASLAIGRIERALSRIEAAQARRPASRPVQGDLLAQSDADDNQNALRAEVAAVIAELDALIAEANHG